MNSRKTNNKTKGRVGPARAWPEGQGPVPQVFIIYFIYFCIDNNM